MQLNFFKSLFSLHNSSNSDKLVQSKQQIKPNTNEKLQKESIFDKQQQKNKKLQKQFAQQIKGLIKNKKCINLLQYQNFVQQFQRITNQKLRILQNNKEQFLQQLFGVNTSLKQQTQENLFWVMKKLNFAQSQIIPYFPRFDHSRFQMAMKQFPQYIGQQSFNKIQQQQNKKFLFQQPYKQTQKHLYKQFQKSNKGEEKITKKGRPTKQKAQTKIQKIQFRPIIQPRDDDTFIIIRNARALSKMAKKKNKPIHKQDKQKNQFKREQDI